MEAVAGEPADHISLDVETQGDKSLVDKTADSAEHFEETDKGVLEEPFPQPQGILKHRPPEEEKGEPQDVTEEIPNKKKKKEKPKRKSVPVWTLFRFADIWDILMIIFGFITAVASGVALPGHMLLFGQVINNFVYYGNVIANNTAIGTTINTAAQSYATSINMTCSPELLINSSFFDMPSGMLLCDSQAQNIFVDVLQFACDPPSELQSQINLFSLYYLGLATGVLLTMFIASLFWNISAYRQTKRMRKAFYHSVLHQEIGWYDVTEANELSTRLADDIEKIQAGIGDKVSLFLNYFSTFVSGFVIAFSISWKMALVVSIMLPLLAFMAGSIAKIIATFTIREQSAYAAAGAVAEEVISSIRTVVAFGGEDHEVERYNVQLGKARAEGMKKGFFASLVVGMLYLVMFCTYALGFWFGSTRIIACELSAGDVVTVFFAVIIGSFSLGNALPELETFGTAMGAASVIFEIIDRKPLIDASSEEGLVPDKLDGNIKFSDVIFNYPARPNVQVLKGLDLEIKNGQTVALVGASGCGKSTVIQLIQRFYNQDGGQITLDGHNIASLNLKWLRSQIGVVSQEPVLFDTTITENIRYGREDASMEDIQAAAKSANAHDFITNLPDGYNTDVGEKGAQLSGGQKQRIAIARALIRNPKLLLLDEATSALDTESEKVVQEALDKARRGRTTIIVAHRLSTIQNADIIVSIECGRVAEMGSHSELMDLEGIYFQLVTAQTIIEEEEEDPTEGLSGFRAAIKRTISKQRAESESSSGNPPPYIKQSSTLSDHSIPRDISWYGLSDHLSRFSIEDIPVASAPSPYPGQRRTYSGSGEVLPDSDDSDGDGGDDEDEGVVPTDGVTELGGSGQEGTKKMRRSTAKRLLTRRNKMAKSDLNLRKVSTKELFRLNIPDWHLVLTGIILSALIGTLFPLMAVLFSEVLRIFGLSDPEEIKTGAEKLAGGFVALAFVSGLVYFFASFTLAIAGERLTKRLRYQSFKAILRQEIGWFDLRTNSTGALTTRLASDSAEVKGATGIRLGTVFQTIFGLLAAIIIAFEASWELTLIMLIAFPILGTVAFFQVRLLSGRSKENKKRLEESGNTAVESIDNIRTVVGLGIEHRFLSRYNSLLRGPFKNNVKSVFLQAAVIAIAQSAVFYLYSGGYSFGAFLVINERATYDELFRVFAAVIFTALSLGRASSFAPDASKAQISAARILSLLERNPLIDSTNTEGQKLDTTTGDIGIKSVHFNYPARPEVKVLQGINVSISPGQTLALVGPSGCGKSTVVSLLERFYDPVLGSATLEGTDLRDYNLKWLRSQIGIVSQEPVLFDCSIADNIRYGTLFKDVSDTEIIEAAKSANIHSFIDSLPEGYNTNVGSKGAQLSGGQKQRVAIARALIRDPKVLLLDEATSALDTESEKVVQEALDKARVGRTTIVIAHRLSTIYNSDVIAVIHNGQVIESGNHTQLMAQCGAYYHLNTVQIQDVDDTFTSDI